jgi:hypothetical protein
MFGLPDSLDPPAMASKYPVADQTPTPPLEGFSQIMYMV